MQGAAHIMMTLDIAINVWLTESYLRVKRLRNSYKILYGRYPDLIRKYQRSVKDTMTDSIHSLTSPVHWYNRFWSFFAFFNTDFVTWIVNFYQLMLVVTGATHEAFNAFSIRSTWLCYRLVRFLKTAYNVDNYYRFCRILLIYWKCCFHCYFISCRC